MVSPGLDLELSFSQAMQGFGLSPEVARLLWLPLPMLLVLVAAVVGVLVSVWLERKTEQADELEFRGVHGCRSSLFAIHDRDHTVHDVASFAQLVHGFEG